MVWPFKKTEKRQAADFTRAVVDRVLAYAAQGGSADVGATAAAATAAGLVGRAFGAASVEPNVDRTGLDPSVLSLIGSSLILAGESVWLIDIAGGMVKLRRAMSWDITGRGPSGWRYRLTIAGPTDHIERNVPEDAVFHPRINQNAVNPARGRSPLALAGLSAKALAEAERQLSEELSGSVGRLIPAPLDQLEGTGGEDDPDPLAEIEAALSNLKGRSALVPSMSKDWGAAGSSGTFAGDWRSERIGADPPSSVVELRRDTHNAVLQAAGVPPMLFSASGQAQASREALRFFLHATVTPYARVVQQEASMKLMVPVVLDFTSLHASDVQGRARAFQSLVAGGMEVERAAGLSGLLAED